MNTSGGLAAGDVFTLDARAEAHTLVVTTAACERVYRSEAQPASEHPRRGAGHGPRAHRPGSAVVRQSFSVRGQSCLRHLPQPTILFQGARLDRRTTIALDPGAKLTFVEGLVLGREAMGEHLTRVGVGDRVEVTLAGRLVLADALRLTDCALARTGPAGLAGARGIGLLLHHDGDLDGALARARATANAPRGRTVSGASIVNGVLVARVLAKSHTALQDELARLVYAVSGAPPPRAWSL